MRTPLLVSLLVLLLVPAAASAAAPTRYYVSLGDSYSVGYQPGKGSTRQGFADQTVALARKANLRLKLVNFGCGGATTTSILQQKGCPRKARALGAPVYRSTQVDAAVRFLRRHSRQVALITVSISGNDVNACVKASDPIACVGEATASIQSNVGTLAARLHRAAPRTKLIGTTYPDVVLGEWVRPNGKQDLAQLSVVAFKQLINPTLQKAYGDAGGSLVDVTEATGAYGPLDQLVDWPPYGQIPQPVARVCELTWYCSEGDIHAKAAGYRVIAELILARFQGIS